MRLSGIAAGGGLRSRCSLGSLASCPHRRTWTPGCRLLVSLAQTDLPSTVPRLSHSGCHVTAQQTGLSLRSGSDHTLIAPPSLLHVTRKPGCLQLAVLGFWAYHADLLKCWVLAAGQFEGSLGINVWPRVSQRTEYCHHSSSQHHVCHVVFMCTGDHEEGDESGAARLLQHHAGATQGRPRRLRCAVCGGSLHGG